MSNKVNVTIDGKAYQFDAGTTILDAAKSLGVEIPTLCHNDKISHYAGCWVCTVELKSGREEWCLPVPRNLRTAWLWNWRTKS